MPACFFVMCVYNDAFRSLCPGRASVESSMSSVKGFSGPASEKIKLFFIGHRRRSAFFLMLAWTLAGTALHAVHAVISVICLPHSLEQPGRQRDLAQRSGLAQRPSERFLRSTAAVLACCVPKSSFEAVASVLQDASTSRVLALGFGWHRRDRLRPRDTRTSLHLTPAPATPSLRAETLRRASHQLPRADDRDSDSD